MGAVAFIVIDAASDTARWAMEQYFGELDARFNGGFDATGALDDAAAHFNPPTGMFLLADLDGTTAGCGAIQFLDAETAEIKRMWVNPACRGTGIGKRILAELEELTQRDGPRRIILDTNEVLSEAIAMYRALGYSPINRYSDNPYAHHWFEKRPTPPPV